MNKSDTKTRILDAAQTLMLSEGFHGVSVDKLITTAGISKGSFFYHFRSKDDLPAALLKRFFACQGQRFQDAFAEATLSTSLSAEERALMVVERVTEIFHEPLDGQPGCVMAAFSYQLMREFGELQEISQQALAGWRAAFSELFLPCLQQQELAEEMAMLLMMLFQGSNVVARVENQPDAIQQAVKHFKLYFHTLCTQLANPKE